MVNETLHELNTPIATIKANVSMLKKSIKEPKNIKRLQRIQKASDNLTKLYESIEYNIKESIEDVDDTEFNLKDIIDESILQFEDIKGDINITNLVPDIKIKTDKNGFFKALNNLISNSIKYNKPNGYIKLFVHDKKLFIEDSGIGIDTKNLFIVFDKAYQENPSTEGFGLGLSIVKTFCDLNKIKITIKTQKDKGTTIALDIKHLMRN